jgi:hypothetical protein
MTLRQFGSVILPVPVVMQHGGISVVRDDLLTGGTKRRSIPVFFEDDVDEYVYASPVQGAAQIALALTARELRKHATVFCAKRAKMHQNTLDIIGYGAKVVEVPMGFLSNVTAKAVDYCANTGAKLLPFGLDDERAVEAIADAARSIGIQPKEVWSITSSGVLSRGLQRAWPDAMIFGVQVGHEPSATQRGRAMVYIAPEKYDKPAKLLPPFPSCATYDAKAWQFIVQHATKSPDTLFWNVSA